MRHPVPCYRCASAQPNGVMPLDVVEGARQGPDSSRAADDPAVQTDRHHARLAFRTLAIQPVECVAAIDEEILAGAEVAATLQAAVIGVEAVGNDQMRTSADPCPVG